MLMRQPSLSPPSSRWVTDLNKKFKNIIKNNKCTVSPPPPPSFQPPYDTKRSILCGGERELACTMTLS